MEARNGHIKTIFKFFGNSIAIQHLPNVGDLYRIAGAIINKYHPSINMEEANVNTAQRFLQRAREPNLVQALVEVDNLHTRNAQRWIRLNSEHVPDFPVLDLHYLRELTIGIYQIHLAPSYIQDKLQRDDAEEFQVEMLRHAERTPQAGLIRVRLYSRFRNATKYQLWITYQPNNDVQQNDEVENNQENQIQGYYCTCKSGARTLGTCAHIASILWFLGYARHEPNIKYPSTKLINVINDAANRPRQENPLQVVEM